MGRLAALAASPALFAAGMLATHREVADGPFGGFARSSLLCAACSTLAYGAVQRYRDFRSRWPMAALLAVLALGASLHVGRAVHPVRRGLPLLEIHGVFSGAPPDPARWDSEVIGPASLAGTDALHIDVPPGAVAWLGPRTLPPQVVVERSGAPVAARRL